MVTQKRLKLSSSDLVHMTDAGVVMNSHLKGEDQGRTDGSWFCHLSSRCDILHGKIAVAVIMHVLLLVLSVYRLTTNV